MELLEVGVKMWVTHHHHSLLNTYAFHLHVMNTPLSIVLWHFSTSGDTVRFLKVYRWNLKAWQLCLLNAKCGALGLIVVIGPDFSGKKKESQQNRACDAPA